MPKITVRREGDRKLNEQRELEMQEIYKGGENTLVRRKWQQKEFICEFFNILKYPFDTEMCSMILRYDGVAGTLVTFNPKRYIYILYVVPITHVMSQV